MSDQEEKDLNVKVEEVDAETKEMADAGVFYGRKKTHTHPRMKPFILQNRNGVEVINLQKTKEVLAEALQFLKAKAAIGGTAIFVGTQPSLEGLAPEAAKEAGVSFILRRWPGGTLTNFKIISKRIEYFKKMKADLASGAFDKYTKKERLQIEREIARLAELFGGLETMTKLPDALIIIDPVTHTTAVREAKQLHIPIIALSNVDADPESIDYPVVGNTQGRQSVSWFLKKMTGAILEGRKTAVVLANESSSPAPSVSQV